MKNYKIVKSKSDVPESFPNLILIDAGEKVARSVVASLKQRGFDGEVGVFGRDNNFNRRALETLKIDYLISPEREISGVVRKDSLKQRDSGMNHVLAKIAKEKGIDVVIDFEDIRKMKNDFEMARRIARLMQNVRICRKAKCGLKIWDFSGKFGKKELGAFGYSLGMSSGQVRDALNKNP